MTKWIGILMLFYFPPLLFARPQLIESPWEQYVTADMLTSAWPVYDESNLTATNWYPTRLYGFEKCIERFGDLADEVIKTGYTDANRIVNIDGVKSNIDWNSAAALEYLGPSALNINQQAQIQDVLANVATVKDGWSFIPNWIHVRCDDPSLACPQECPATGQSDGDPDEEPIDKVRIIYAYSRNPDSGGEKWPWINFCLPYFARPTLDIAVSQGSAPSNPVIRFDMEKYILSQGEIFLHELFHLDLAANTSPRDTPNPRINDLLIRWYYRESGGRRRIGPWTKAYEPALAKMLARFTPRNRLERQTGEFVQRNDDNYVYFALSNYVARIIGGYPFKPVIMNRPRDAPLAPNSVTPEDPFIFYTPADNDSVPLFELFEVISTPANVSGMVEGSDDCNPTDAEADVDGDIELGPENDDSLYPQAYWAARSAFLTLVQADMASN